MTRGRIAVSFGAVAYVALAAATIVSLRLPAEFGFTTLRTPRGDVVGWVMPASAAWNAGIRAGDHLIAGVARAGRGAVAVLRAHGGPLAFDPERPRLGGASAAAALGLGTLILLLCASGIDRTG